MKTKFKRLITAEKIRFRTDKLNYGAAMLW